MRHQRHGHDRRYDRTDNAYAGLGDYGAGGSGRYDDETQAWYSVDGGEGQEHYYDIGLGRYGDEERGGDGQEPADDQGGYGQNRHGGGQGGYGYQARGGHADDAGWGERDDGSRGLSREDWSGMHVEEGYARADEQPRAGTERGRGELRGMGPKGWVRADERIREDVCELLSEADVDASDIAVKVDGGEVTLEGNVDSRWAKREAEDVVYQARGVKECHNRLRVQAAR